MYHRTKLLTTNTLFALNLALLLLAVSAQAMTPAGTWITGQAEAVYFDTQNGIPLRVLSNHSSVKVAAVAAFRLDQNQSQTAVAGQQIIFIHKLTHLGNISDQFQITVTTENGISLNKLSVYEYHGVLPNQDTQPLNKTPALQPGESRAGSHRFCSIQCLH